MEFLKNIFKILVGGFTLLIMIASMIPTGDVVYVWCVSIPMIIIANAYCMNKKITIDDLIEKFKNF